MNKLEGFFALQTSGLPTVPWKQFLPGTRLDPALLWTVRSALTEGDDLNLPRRVGVAAWEAEAFAASLLGSLGKSGLVIYYPFFLAEKSGVLEVCRNKTVVEAVQGDLWNLVTHNRLDLSITLTEGGARYTGNKDFMNEQELDELTGYADLVRRKFRDLLLESCSIFLEWSYAAKSDTGKNPLGGPELVFYEMRTVG